MQLAPGGHLGRFTIYTKAAIEKMDSIFGTLEVSSETKTGFKIPRTMMANPDVARLINSDEIQSVVNAPKFSKQIPMKKNPLKNMAAMIKLNPYAKEARKQAIALHVSPYL
jgi:large subunit ribosomal protein L4e